MLNYEELACVKDFAPHFDSFIKLQNWNKHSVYKVSSSEFETKLPVFILEKAECADLLRRERERNLINN
ncbi:MAG: hypothetical protein MSA27_02780 [Spirochaetia bacterium]|nr:hypothetical protein [Spirochaetia bacterium]